MEEGRLDTLGRWMWGAVCLMLIGLAFFQGGLPIVGFVIAAIVAYAILFAVAVTVVIRVNRHVSTTSAQKSPSVWSSLASNFRKALVDGPLFVLAFC